MAVKKRTGALLVAAMALGIGVAAVEAMKGPCVMRGPEQPPGACQSLTRGFRVEKGVPFPASDAKGDCVPVACP